LYTSDGATLPNTRVSAGADLSRWTDWNPITKEQILTGTLEPLKSYSGSKTLAERAVWEFAAEHPDINITICKHTVLRLDAENPQIDPQSQ
jgi:nucleoside-diphosphate-sugar epimerase